MVWFQKWFFIPHQNSDGFFHKGKSFTDDYVRSQGGSLVTDPELKFNLQ